MKIFISWSGSRSKIVAEALNQLLPEIIQSVKPWISTSDINAGARWSDNVARELEASNFGIICVTQDNQRAPWLLFEAGALAKSVEKSLVCPYLIDLEPSQLESGPLSQFQAKKADMESTLNLMRTINNNTEGEKLDKQRLENIFHRW